MGGTPRLSRWGVIAMALAVSCAASGATGATTPSLYVSPTGSASSSCAQSQPCASFDRAYRLAQPGQVVQVAEGTYPGQVIKAVAAKANAPSNVVFEPAPGASVVLAGGLQVSASHVEFRRLRLDLSRCVNTQIAPPCPSLVINSGAHDIVVDDFRASKFYITGAYNITIKNSDFGPSYDFHGIIHADTAGQRPHDIVLSNVSVHDHWNSDACIATAGCVAQHHQGCGPTLNDAYNVLEDRMRFYNCQNLGQLIKPYRFANENITIQNSWFGPNKGFYSLDLTSNKRLPNRGLHIRNNTFSKTIAITRGITYPNSQLTGNSLPNLACSLFSTGGWDLSGNIVAGSGSCG